MKRLLAILTLFTVVMAWPLAGVAGAGDGDAELQPQHQAQGVELPEIPHHDDDLLQDQNDGQGDPHDLGGGFRGTGTASGFMPDPTWLGPFWTLIMQLV